MKVAVLIACMLVFGCASAATKYNHVAQHPQPRFLEVGVIVEDLINSLIGLLDHIDPIDVSELGFNFLGTKMDIKNLHVEGFSDIVSKVSVDIGVTAIYFKFGATAHRLVASVEQWESTLPVVYGKGNASAEVNDISMFLAFDLNYFTGSFEPSIITTGVGSAKISLTGYHNDEALSQELSNTANNFLNNVFTSEEFTNSLENSVDDFLGVALKKSLKH